jgi:hypothetical protein
MARAAAVRQADDTGCGGEEVAGHGTVTDERRGCSGNFRSEKRAVRQRVRAP